MFQFDSSVNGLLLCFLISYLLIGLLEQYVIWIGVAWIHKLHILWLIFHGLVEGVNERSYVIEYVQSHSHTSTITPAILRIHKIKHESSPNYLPHNQQPTSINLTNIIKKKRKKNFAQNLFIWEEKNNPPVCLVLNFTHSENSWSLQHHIWASTTAWQLLPKTERHQFEIESFQIHGIKFVPNKIVSKLGARRETMATTPRSNPTICPFSAEDSALDF